MAPGFGVEARRPHDRIVEAMRLNGSEYVAAVQRHPEFHPPGKESVWNDAPMLEDFLRAARAARNAAS